MVETVKLPYGEEIRKQLFGTDSFLLSKPYPYNHTKNPFSAFITNSQLKHQP